MNIHKVIIAKRAEKDLRNIPSYVVLKLQAWIDDVTARGLNEVRKVLGFHDELLKDKRKGQRSIRLSKSYRAIYEIDQTDTIYFVEIMEVNKHEY